MTDREEFDSSFTEDDHLFHGDYLTDERAEHELAEILALLDELDVPASGSILDAGCGDGRIAIRLAKRGFRVIAVDVDPDQIRRAAARAAQAGVAIDLRTAPIQALVLEEPVDVVLLWFNTFGFLDDEGNAAVLDRVASSLRPGGAVIIDTLNRWAVERDLLEWPGPVVVRSGAATQTDESRFDRSTERLLTTRTVVRGSTTRVRHLSLQLPSPLAWPALLARHGLQVVSVSGRDGESLNDEAWPLVIVATTMG